jgi:integrase
MDLPETVAAFERAIAVGAIADEPQPFSTQSLYKTWQRACRRVERAVRAETQDPTFRIPHIRLKDIRHSFGTLLFEKTGDLDTVREMLQHAPGSAMANRYTLGAVPSVLRAQMQKVAASTPRRRSAGVLPKAKPAIRLVTTGESPRD